jgi:uncharacterized membrane protein YhaH (DUF805 family)
MVSPALALAFFQDSSDQTQQITSMMSGLGAGIIIFAVLFGVALVAFFIFLFWRIFVKAGMSGALSLLILLYPIGFIIVLCILAFGQWKVIPAPVAAPYYPPPPPPPPAFPPQS